MVDENTQKTSEYNTAALINARLNNEWTKFLAYLESGRFNKCDLVLNSLWIELAGDLEEDEYTNKNKEFIKIENELASCGSLRDSDDKGFEEVTEEDMRRRVSQYKVLVTKGLFLKRIEKLLGKGTKFKESADDYMSS